MRLYLLTPYFRDFPLVYFSSLPSSYSGIPAAPRRCLVPVYGPLYWLCSNLDYSASSSAQLSSGLIPLSLHRKPSQTTLSRTVYSPNTQSSLKGMCSFVLSTHPVKPSAFVLACFLSVSSQ